MYSINKCFKRKFKSILYQFGGKKEGNQDSGEKRDKEKKHIKEGAVCIQVTYKRTPDFQALINCFSHRKAY